MPLVLLDLDDTLLDRAGAVRVWATDLLDRIGAPLGDLDWLLSVDADGLTSRWDLADAIRQRYRLDVPAIDIVDDLTDALIELAWLDPMVACALEIAADSGWVPVIVTNGPELLQEEKIRRAKLDKYVADWVISEQAGVSKPNPRIFALAAQRQRMNLRGAWVIGKGPEEDIGGAAEIGLPSVWLHRGRRWIEDRYTPTRTASGVIAALATVMSARPGRATA